MQHRRERRNDDEERRREAARKLHVAFDLFETGIAIKRAAIAREHPAETPGDHERRLAEWLRTRPGAEHGDGVGRPVAWPRRRA